MTLREEWVGYEPTDHEHCAHAYSSECCACAGEDCRLAPAELSHLEAFWRRRVVDPLLRLWLRWNA